ncbi:aminotransferase class V-fold PLP-dependent enzyme, partial [Psychrobacter sp. CAL346-MNA-CIBAN-0220]|uniref:aminotransferase class V-fold PLP-dependent enzyme n=1 Tax=Psychrobacter sp. CAL346-MNA-CIBAN-0220 TaxID=3140457 RepID=UPI00332BD622
SVLRPDTALVTLMYANNEIGTVQNLAALGSVTSAHKIPFHTDAVQAAGWLDLRVGSLGVDALSLAGHKIGAPKGIGLAWLRGRIPVEPL